MSFKRRIIALLLVAALLLTQGCRANKLVIKGQYQCPSAINLSDIKLQFTLQDANSHVKQKKFYLNKDGSFYISFPFTTLSVGYFELLDYPKDVWKAPFLSNHNEYYEIDSEKCKIQLDNIYISDQTEILSPKNRSTVNLYQNYVVSWEPDPFATFYHIVIVRQKESSLDDIVFFNAYQINSNSIELQDLIKLPIVKENLTFEDWSELNGFIRKQGTLKNGLYKISVQGYLLDSKSQRQIYTSQSSENIFRLKIE